MNGYSGQGATPSLGNPDLEPETSVNLRIGFNYQPTDTLNLTTTAFFNQFKDKIISKILAVKPMIVLISATKLYFFLVKSFNAY